VRAGILNFAKGGSESMLRHFARALGDLEAAGAILVNINDRPNTPEKFGQMSYDILKYEFKDSLNASLTSTSAEKVKTRTL
jgi:amidase